jgi:phospholipid/cholesterol/gamma-HCH transport system substrate-binding protein
MRRSLPAALVAALVLGSSACSLPSNGYRVRVNLQSATNLVEGGRVLVNGFDAGEIENIEVKDGQAVLELGLDDEYGPLHAGAVVNVEWRALLSERHVNVVDGPATHAEIPDGGMLKGVMPKPTELDQVLAALDPKTRTRLASLVQSLDETVDGNERDLRTTLQEAGPALSALGAVVRAVGKDGPAIQALVRQLNSVVHTLGARDSEIRRIVSGLGDTATRVATQRHQLSNALERLPGTLSTANQTLGNVPEVADKVVPLLDELRPASARLPGVARNLRPILQDLRPMMRELRPTLDAANQLLDHTPGLLESAHPALSGLKTTVQSNLPVAEFLRPYTPEIAAYFGGWGSAFGNYDSNGHYARLHMKGGALSANRNPGVLLPGYQNRPFQHPGEAGNQPWTDAYGSGMR